MKKGLLFLMIISLILSSINFTACREDTNPTNNNPVETAVDELQLARDTAEQVMNCFINKDEEALFSLLSQVNKEFFLTREQIQGALDFVDGEIISYDLPTDTGAVDQSIESGKVVSKSISPDVKSIITDSGKRYKMSIQHILKSRIGDSVVGVTTITIVLTDEGNNDIYDDRARIGLLFENGEIMTASQDEMTLN